MLWERVCHYGRAKSNNSEVHQTQRQQIHIGWIPPDVGWVKLNIDGPSIKGEEGVICGSEEEWLGGFVKRICQCNVLMAEMCGVMEGFLK
jgi:hypothetical protein